MLKNYLLIAYKVLLRRKFFTFISLAGISLTLMILIVYAAFMENVLGAIPPESRGDRILGVFQVEFSRDNRSSRSIAGPGYQFLTEYIKIQTLPHIEYASVLTSPRSVEGVYGGRMFKLLEKMTDGDYWKILDFNFIEGGPFTSADYENARFVAVINQSVRKRMFGRGAAIGETITVDGQDFTVIGVVADVPIFREIPFSEVWVPLTTAKTDAYISSKQFGLFKGIVLAENREVIPAIREEYRTRVSRNDYPYYRDYNTATGEIQTYFDYIAGHGDNGLGDSSVSGGAKSSLAILIIILPILLFMVLPVLNLVNINLSRIMERSSEIGVRKAFGASSWYLVGQFLVENVILTLLGGILGLFMSFGVLRLFTTFQLIPYSQFRFNGWVFFYGFLITVVFGLLSGVYPAWKMSRYHPVEALRKSPF
jgi:putative ABC transport system permease protein